MPIKTKTHGHGGDSKGVNIDCRLKRGFRSFIFVFVMLIDCLVSQMLLQGVLFELAEKNDLRHLVIFRNSEDIEWDTGIAL